MIHSQLAFRPRQVPRACVPVFVVALDRLTRSIPGPVLTVMRVLVTERIASAGSITTILPFAASCLKDLLQLAFRPLHRAVMLGLTATFVSALDSAGFRVRVALAALLLCLPFSPPSCFFLPIRVFGAPAVGTFWIPSC